MILLIDAGNTNTSFALYEGSRYIHHWVCASYAQRTSDEYVAWLTQLMALKGYEPSLTDIALACVLPEALFPLTQLCKRHFHIDPLVITPTVTHGVDVCVDRPEEVGADRIAASVAAYALKRQAVLVVDFGTATTLDVVDHNGAYRGGVIAPGVQLSVEVLHRATARLPKVSIEAVPRVIGTNTVTCIQSGVFWGYISMIEGLIQRIGKEHGNPAIHVVCTGGLAPFFLKHMPRLGTYEPTLVLDGMAEILHRHRNHS